MAKPRNPRIDLTRPAALIHEALTESLVDLVWKGRREAERVRMWGLGQLASFWIAVCYYAPTSLRSALSQKLGLGAGPFPVPDASPQAFFSRSQSLPWEFFADLFAAFRLRVDALAPRAFAGELQPLFERFPAIQAVDGSRLDPVRRRLKMLWNSEETVLPGSILAFYDLATGTLAQLIFREHAMASEFRGAVEAFSRVAPGTLLLGDRLYGVVRFFEALSARGLFGVARRFSVVWVGEKRLLSTAISSKGRVEDWAVQAGTGQTAPRQTLRLIRLVRPGKKALELFTNVLDPQMLSAEEALDLYRQRWKVERLFSDLKEVLSLHQIYGANVNAVAMQVYAAAILHTALRICQARAAQQGQVAPESISTKKFFPMAAIASATLIAWMTAALMIRRANPGVDLNEPDWHAQEGAYTTLDKIRVEVRRSLKGRGRRPSRVRKWKPWPEKRENGTKLS